MTNVRLFSAILFSLIAAIAFAEDSVPSAPPAEPVPAAAEALPANPADPAPSEADRRRETVEFGTDAELLDLVKKLEEEKTDYLDDSLLALLSKTENAKIKETLFSLFTRRKKPGAEERALKLIEGREDEKRAVVEAAISYVGTMKAEGASAVLRQVIDGEEKDGPLLAASIRALGSCGGEEDAVYLMDRWEKDSPTDAVQQEIVIALGEIGSASATALLAGIVAAEDSKTARKMAALEALSRIGDPAGLEAVLSGLADADANVRSSAIAALGPFQGADADKAILEAFRDSFYKARAGAAKAAGERRMEAAVPYLRYRAERDEVAAVRNASMRALAKIGGDAAYEALLALFGNQKTGEALQIVAAEALLEGWADRSIGKIVLAADAAREKKRTVYANGLMKALSAARSSALETLAGRLLDSKDLVDRHWGLDMVTVNSFASHLEKVRELSKDKNETLARKARAALAAIGAE